MSPGVAFAVGLVAGELIVFLTLGGNLGRWLTAFGALGRVAFRRVLPRPSWEIQGVRYFPRRQTRAVMEEIVQASNSSLSDVLPLPLLIGAIGGGGFDEDEFRSRVLQDHAAKIEAGYATCSLLLEDENGHRPSVDLLSEALTFDEVTRIVGRILA